jgi:pyrroloquinoline quinone (PQQ) biosynthesis protein C
MPATLRRSAPFLLPENGQGQASYLIDTLAVVPEAHAESPLLSRVADSLDLSSAAAEFPSEVAIEIVSDQYEACMDFMYSHPVWERFRSGTGQRAVLAYLMESRHYLHAAASRMAPGPGIARNVECARVLAEHVVEEADHAIFFENGLAELGCDRATIRASRPSPVTLEWIHLMRAMAYEDPLVAGVCSGLMESTAADKPVILGWHEMVVANGLLPQNSVDAIFEHIRLDMELGHGGNWREVIEALSPIPCRRLHAALNGACSVAEMLHRWFGALESSLSAEAAALAMEIQATAPGPPLDVIDPAFSGVPVWPAEVFNQVTYGASEPVGARLAIALAYHYDDRLTDDAHGPYAEAVRSIQRPAGLQEADDSELSAIARSWLRAVEGHRLWEELCEEPTVGLVYGWLLENCHYLASAVGHVSSAVAACPDSEIRALLVKHLKDEAEHSEILRAGLAATYPSLRSEASRPLPTTTAFLGCLRDLAASDWKAYCLALGFLQFTLSPGDTRHAGFYQAVLAKCPEARPLVDAMKHHDVVDIAGDHETDISGILGLLEQRHAVDQTNIARAAVIPQLAWSFLDGIRTHYVHGLVAVMQRVGWAPSS